MPEDNIEVVHSEEGGNGLPTDVTPSATPEIKADPAPVDPTPVDPVVPEVELFELPDGRKVDAATLSKEWKENFYPDYTKKSQALAAKSDITNPKPEPAENPYANPDYVPQSYEELLKVAEERALLAFENKQKEAFEAQQAVETEVATQLDEVKALEPNLNENALFLHATKYGFTNLKVAYQNMKDMNQIVKTTQKVTADNIAKRNDPVSITPGATGSKPNPSDFSTARDYLRSLK